MTLEELNKHIKKFENNEIELGDITNYLQKFLDEDDRLINLGKLRHYFSSIYNFIVRSKYNLSSNLVFRKPGTKPNQYSFIKTLDDIQKFVRDNKIKDPKDFRTRFKIVDRLRLKILSPEEQCEIEWCSDSTSFYRYNFKFLKTTEDWQKYIDKKGLEAPIDLMKISGGLYGKYFRLPVEEREKIKWKKERPIKNLPKEKRSWAHITTLDQVQEFIYENNVVNWSDLQKRFRGLANKFQGKLNLINYVGPMNITTGEAYLIRNLIKYNVNFVFQKTYPDCRNIEVYRFDLHLIDFDILLEYHGAAHFGEGIRYSEDLIIADKVKNEYAKSHGIRIYYFTFEKKLYEERGYFDKVYTDIDELFSEMGINTSIINQNYNEEVKEYFSQDINYFNKFIQRNKVISLKDLRDRFPTVYYRINRNKYQGYLNYYKS